MNTTNKNSGNVADNLGTILSRSFEMYKGILETGFNATNLKLPTSSDCDACAPKEECPPKFIGKLYRSAMPNECIIVPFIINNGSSVPKTYRIGMRELKDNDGNLAPIQPKLNKNTVVLPPNGQERILIGLQLANFSKGTYETEVVVREKDYNQNILLTVDVQDVSASVFTPLDEKKYNLKWQSWKTHFYCERPRTQHNNG